MSHVGKGMAGRIALSALSGFFLFACFPKLDWNALVWVACAPLLITLVSEARARRGFIYGYIAGVIFLTGSCYWFVGVMRTYGGLSVLAALGVLFLFAMLFALYYGVFGLLVTAASRRSLGLALILSPFLWVALELARTYVLTGFPWNLLGYAVRPPGLQQIAAVTAVYGLSFLAVASSALLAALILQPRPVGIRVGCALWIVILLAANRMLAPPAQSPGPDTALLLQPNIPLAESKLDEWAPWINPARLNQLVDLSVAAGRSANSTPPPLLIWPEDPAPFYYDRDPVFHGAISALAQEARAYVVAGTTTFRGAGYTEPQNSAVMLDPSGKLLLQYDKIHLVPFGEYVPWWGFPGKTGKITSQVGDFVPGRSYKVAQTPEGKVGVFICYEAIFPQLVRQIALAGAQVFVNISDDGWYGSTSARFQHLEMARFRAIENRRYLLRSTNDGITVVIDPYGRVVKQAELYKRVVLIDHFGYETQETFYTRFGDVFAWLCVVAACGLAAFGLWRVNARVRS